MKTEQTTDGVAWVYHVETAMGDVIAEGAKTLAEAVAQLDSVAECSRDWTQDVTNGGQACETATIIVHGRPCGIAVRVKQGGAS